MKITSRQIKSSLAIILLTTIMSWFYYAHESIPQPFRAITALFATPVAIASGLSHYLNLGIPVYETSWAVVLTNLIFSVALVYIIDRFLLRKYLKGKK